MTHAGWRACGCIREHIAKPLRTASVLLCWLLACATSSEHLQALSTEEPWVGVLGRCTGTATGCRIHGQAGQSSGAQRRGQWGVDPQAAGYTGKVKIGMDVAASEFMTPDKKYDLDFKTKDNDGSQVLTGCAQCFAATQAACGRVTAPDSCHWLGQLVRSPRVGGEAQSVGERIQQLHRLPPSCLPGMRSSGTCKVCRRPARVLHATAVSTHTVPAEEAETQPAWCRGREELKKLYTKFTSDFPIVTIEDPFDQDDWDNTAAFTAEGVCQARTPLRLMGSVQGA